VAGDFPTVLRLTAEQHTRFKADGFVIVENILDGETVAAAAERFAPLFRGEFETGAMPDEWNWREGRDSDHLTRQICNGWKSDRVVASIVLGADIGRACAELMGWPGARLNQDNVLWKPPGAAALGHHQDASYESWVVPREMATCWMTLDATSADGGTIEYVRGSHRWGLSPPISQFHAPADHQVDMRRAAAAAGVEPDVVRIECAAGSGVLHHGRTWHGSAANRSNQPRRSLVAHCMSSEARFHPTNVSAIYGRYKRPGELSMDESFFPILWTQKGRRTDFLEEYVVGLPQGP
jgi:ectoine hydroxylase-related dioxygenase (phytanoyl-CoA dioxygenase family)